MGGECVRELTENDLDYILVREVVQKIDFVSEWLGI